MSMISTIKVNKGKKAYPIMMERYTNAAEMVRDLRTRPITNSSFDDQRTKGIDTDWVGAKSYDECLEYLEKGYQPTVDTLRTALKPTVGTTKRISFKNDIVGGMPIVPLAMMNLPNAMINTYIKPIKAKVIDIYYDMGCSWTVKSKDIIEAGQKLLATIMKFEQEGYKFNLYAVQSYCSSDDADILAIKVKSSSQPVDLKRMSYALTHTSFFRVLGFDWYSKTPKGKYRHGYGHAISVECDNDPQRTNEFAKQIFGNNSIYLSAMIMNKSYKDNKDEYISTMINPK